MKYVSHNISKALTDSLKNMNDVSFVFALFELTLATSISKETSQIPSYTLWSVCKNVYAYTYG